ncbi:MAG: hypothetical protein V9G22_17115 [Ottowia sp.]
MAGWVAQQFVIATRLTYQLIILGVTAFLMAPLRGGRLAASTC